MPDVLVVDRILSDSGAGKEVLVKVRKELQQDPAGTFNDLVRNASAVGPYAEVCRIYVQEITRSGRGFDLLEYCHCNINQTDRFESAATCLILVLQWISHWQELSSQILKRAEQDKTVRSQLCILLHVLASYECGIEIVSHQGLKDVMKIDSDNNFVKYLWQVHPSKEEVAKSILDEVMAEVEPEIEVKKRYDRQEPVDEPTFMALWQMIVDHAALALRQEGDYIAFKDPDLATMNVKGFLVKSRVWPNVGVTLKMELFGVEIDLPVKMDNGLVVELETFSPAYQGYLNLAILAGIRHIVGDDRLPTTGTRLALVAKGAPTATATVVV